MPLLLMAVATTMHVAVYVGLPVRSAAELVLGVGHADRGGLRATFTSAVNAITLMTAARLPLAVP